MRTPRLWISGLGTFVPPAVTVASAVREGRCTEQDAASHQMAGAAVAGPTPAPEMALRAAREAFAQSHAAPEDTRLLLYADTWHQGPDGWFPQYHLQRNLVQGDVLAMEVRQGCVALLNAVELAAPYLDAAGDGGCALLVASDNYGTPGVDRWRTGDFLLGDGACAVVLTRDTGFARILSVGSAVVPELEELNRCGEPEFPPGATTGVFFDYKARVRAFTERSAKRPAAQLAWLMLQKKMLTLVHRTVAEAGLGLHDIARAALTSLAAEAFEHRWLEVLGLSADETTWELSREIGHIGAADPFLGLRHLIDSGELEPGDHALIGGVGSGVTAACAVVQVTGTAETAEDP